MAVHSLPFSPLRNQYFCNLLPRKLSKQKSTSCKLTTQYNSVIVHVRFDDLIPMPPCPSTNTLNNLAKLTSTLLMKQLLTTLWLYLPRSGNFLYLLNSSLKSCLDNSASSAQKNTKRFISFIIFSYSVHV